MSTRAVYTYEDDGSEFHLYKHFDNSPENAIHFIKKATNMAWELPRFDAGDAAASFIVVNKKGAGDVYLTTSWRHHRDLDYRYKIEMKNNELNISIFQAIRSKEEGEQQYKLIAVGTLYELQNSYKINC